MLEVIFTWLSWLQSLPPPDEPVEGPTVTVSTEATSRGATFDYARVESEYRCTKQLAEMCSALKLERPAYISQPWPHCFEQVDGIHNCTAQCAGECAEPPSEGE